MKGGGGNGMTSLRWREGKGHSRQEEGDRGTADRGTADRGTADRGTADRKREGRTERKGACRDWD